MQFLAPWLKGMKAQGWRLALFSGRKRSGLNWSASGPHSFLDRCITKGATAQPTPAGMVTFAKGKKLVNELFFYK